MANWEFAICCPDFEGFLPGLLISSRLVSRDSDCHLGIGNGGGKQGRGNQPPLSTLRTRYGNSVSTPEATQNCKTQQNSLRKGSPYRISVSTSSIWTRLRTPFLWTPFPRSLCQNFEKVCPFQKPQFCARQLISAVRRSLQDFTRRSTETPTILSRQFVSSPRFSSK